tara:strand:- start:4957 stop:5718 length:762 start_codon:yes stop_codon:yes gene_type:complete
MKSKGYDPIKLTETTEQIVIQGNKRKYANLARHLRFYGGTISATEVGCNLRCKFCFSEDPVRKPATTGKFYSPEEVFDALIKKAKKHGTKLISASASEGTLGKQHLFDLLDLVDKTDYIYILETNGMTIGHDESFAKELSRFKNLHVRVSIKGCNYEEYAMLTSAKPESYDIPYRAIKNLIDSGVSCNACLSISFSSVEEVKKAEKRLYDIKPGILKSLEKEYITMFPKVQKRLNRYNLRPNKVRQFGKIIDY